MTTLDHLKSTKALAAVRDVRRPAIRLNGVRKDYKLYRSLSDQALDVLGMSWLRVWRPVHAKTFTALAGVNLDVGHGERIGIVGRNGAGKSTLLKLITGNFAPSAGTIEVDGTVQALMQTGLGFHGEFTGMENIRSALVYNGLAGRELDQAVDDIIEFCELADFIEQPVKTYSLGMRTRLQFAAATAIKPDIVIIDEVLGAGDAYFAGKSAARVRRLTESGATLLIVSHSMQQILQFSSKAIWMEEGKIMHVGDPLEVVNLYEEFIHTREKKRGIATDGDVAIPEWIQQKAHPVRETGSDWGGEGPLRAQRVDVIDKAGRPIDTLKTGEPFGFRVTVLSDEKDTFLCSSVFVVYDEGGEVVCRIIQPEQAYDMKNGPKVIECWFDQNPIGQGDYTLSVGLYRNFDVAAPATSYRYHILSRGKKFTVRSPQRNSCKITMDGEWSEKAELQL